MRKSVWTLDVRTDCRFHGADVIADNRITGINQDDLKLLGRPFVSDPKFAKVAGLVPHFVNSVALAWIYGATNAHLPGTAGVRGTTFALIEGTVLYPVALFEDLHPGIRDGQVDRYWSLAAYLQSIPRHVAYGLTLGPLYDRLSRSKA